MYFPSTFQLPDTSSLDALHKEWPVIKAAPYSFFLALGILLAIGATIIWLLFRHRLERYREQVEHLGGDIEHLKNKIERLKENETSLQRNVDHLTADLQKAKNAPPVRVSEERLALDVVLKPSQGEGTVMYLGVTNRGPQQPLQAQCEILERRNDGCHQLIKYDLRWHTDGQSYTMSRGQSGNLIIAAAGPEHDIEWLQLEAALGQLKPLRTQWPRGQKGPEIDVELTIFGPDSDRKHVERFTVRTDTSAAVAMVKLENRATKPALPTVSVIARTRSVTSTPAPRNITQKTPKQLKALYEGRTMLQGDKLMDPFKGMWIYAEGRIMLVGPDNIGSVAAIDGDGASIECRFGPQWNTPLARYDNGDTIKVIGRISETQNGQQLYLRDCELV